MGRLFSSWWGSVTSPKNRRIAVPTLVTLALTILMLMLPNPFRNPVYDHYETVKARVISVDNTFLRHTGILYSGEQSCEIQVLQGTRKGQTMRGINLMSSSLESDKLFEPGDTALILLSNRDDTSSATMIDHYRIPYISILVGIFVLLLVAFAGWLGLRAILSFIFTVLAIFKVLIPLMLEGYNPILSSMFISVLTTTVIILLVYGWTREFAAATVSTVLGTVSTAVIALVFIGLVQINGAVMPYAESLIYAGYPNLNLTAVLIGSIFLACSGALTDIAVDITSAIHEVIEKRPDISRLEAIKSGLYVGRNAIGTMTTTLLLAYSGGYIGMLMVFVAQGTPINNVLNLNYVAAEIINTMAGSIGLVLVAPLSAVIGGIMLVRRKGDREA